MSKHHKADYVVDTSDREYGLVWRYLAGGTVRHGLTCGSHGRADFSVCGLSAHLPGGHDAWRGTGTQQEYERAAALPKCKRCMQIAIGRPTP